MAAGTVYGVLAIAGTAKEVSFPFKGKVSGENEIECDTTYKINMTDYGIDPPTYMLGVIKTGQEVDITIHLKLQTE